jgi:CubicO group peptidase (beta-lactamase class C family)
MLLGFLLERIWERSLDEVCERLVFGPLELYQTCFAGNEGLPVELCAATEVGNEYENKRCQAFCDPVHFPWRGNTICGEAHDGNAFYGLDGIAGHAGLFSTAGDLSRFAEIWVRKGVYKRERFLDATLVALATACHGMSGKDGYGFGWTMSAVGETKPNAPSKSFGLVSGTGASVWCEPLTKTTSVVLTNRLHPEVKEEKGEWYEEFHRRVFVE